MYYPIGRCVMKKASRNSLPTMIGVADEKSTAQSLAKALARSRFCHDSFAASTQVFLTFDGQERVFNMNDLYSVNNVLNEVKNNA